MAVECGLRFFDDGVAQSRIANPHDWIQFVRDPSQIPSLSIAEAHARILAYWRRSSTVVTRSKSSAHWVNKHLSDPYLKQAQAAGWRSRAVFKLEEIDRKEQLLQQGMTVLDLGAAPGAWSQYAQRRVGKHGRVIASDILAIEPLAGVEFLQGDFREEAVFARLRELIGPGGVDVVLSDMAPNMAGIDVIDQPRSMYLAELAVDMSVQVLKPGGATLIKTFQGAGFPDLVASMRKVFGKVRLAKPAAASRERSPELYVVGRDFKGSQS